MTTIRMPARCACGGADCMLMAVDDRHGTPNGYHNARCRCDPCRYAVREERRSRAERRADEGMRCPNCNGDPGLYADGLCHACYEFQRRHGQPRPPVAGRLCDVERHCANCAKRMLPGAPRRHGRCEACARYLDRNDVERPSDLWRPLESDAADDDHLAGDQVVAS